MLTSGTPWASDPGLSPEVERLLTEIANDGFVSYCCGRRDAPTALVTCYPWPRQVDLVVIRDFAQITTARVHTPQGTTHDVFTPQLAVWAYHGPAATALRALLDLPHPQHPDAPTTPFPAPRSLHVPRHEQRPMTIRLTHPDRAGVRATRLAAALHPTRTDTPSRGASCRS